MSLGLTQATALAVIFFFNFFITVAKDYVSRPRFLAMVF